MLSDIKNNQSRNRPLIVLFEMGYTGCNGRLGQASSGLGLYLAKKAADLLAIPLTAESVVGVGTAFTLDLRQNE